MVLSEFISVLQQRQVADGGFANGPGGSPRADATCWAVLALSAAGGSDDRVRQARQALAQAQSSDGRVCLTPRHANAFWPTPLAVLAWHRCRPYGPQQGRAVRFLLGFDQLRIVDDPEAVAIIGHDPTIKGWPWIADTSPWLEPTAYCLMALCLAGFAGHERTHEGCRLILDRQLPAGGWNYGNTSVYGQELRPMPETTAIALQALADLVPREEVAKSIDYLRSQLPRLRTPLALAWAILGLAAWQAIEDPRVSIRELLGILPMPHRQDADATTHDAGSWDTVSLSLLVLAGHCPQGLMQWLRQMPEALP
jgi:hypothetical protein